MIWYFFKAPLKYIEALTIFSYTEHLALKNLILNIIVKLGSGTSLPGILAAKCGGNVTLSDSEDLPHCLENCRKSCQANGLLDIPVIGITWGRFNEALLDLPPVDIILGSDCFYDSKGQNLYFSHI